MKLSFTGAPEVAAPLAVTWDRLMDPSFVSASAPGVEKVEAIDPEHFKVIVAFGVGAIKVRFHLDVELFDVQAPSHAKMRARGKAPGSTLDVTATIDLSESAPGMTRMAWRADSDVGGTVASVGARLLEGTAKKLTEQFWGDFARRVGAHAAA
ncbi:MAG: carbon monoxide dehydrogenase subunit G [Gemmatimonadales bacterium]|nr:carbon monoxide dehydrogenase subunit G [Gemmatimonadales bacterium]